MVQRYICLDHTNVTPSQTMTMHMHPTIRSGESRYHANALLPLALLGVLVITHFFLQVRE